ncbi:MAG: hypothetical protein AAFR73_12715, partial [Pseudomonadota bacterium]
VNYFLTIEGYQYDSVTGATPEAALSAVLVSSASHANIRTDNGGLTVLAAASSPWDSQLPDHTEAGSFGEWVQSLIKNSIADAVWDEPVADHTTPGSTGEAIQASGGGGDATSANQTAILDAINLLNDVSIADMEASAALTATADVSGLATAASIAALNDFNPATDTVARVTLVDTTTANTDMRGTDGAATSAGDATAAQQTAILSAISALNDPTASEIATAVEAAILNEGDGQQVIDAIVQAIGNENVTAATIASAVWSAAARTLTGTTDANIVEVTGQPISGAGTKADPWGP